MKRLIALSFVVLFCSHLFGNSLINTLAGEDTVNSVNKYYTSIEIKKGDTLWSIAGKYSENSGLTRSQYLKELKDMNGLREDRIQSGRYLTVMYFDVVDE